MWRWWALLPCVTPLLAFQIGVQSILGPQYQETLTLYLSNATGYEFQAVTYTNDSLMIQDAASGRIQFSFVGPVQYLCLALAGTTSDGVAELVSASYLDGTAIEHLAGAIVVAVSSDIRTLSDLHNRTILTGPISSLTTFAAQWAVLLANNISLFQDTRGVFLQPNITSILPDLLQGVGDAAFVPASYIERYYPQQIQLFRIINSRQGDGIPYLHSTLSYPNVVLAALDSIPYTVRRAMAEALFALRSGDPIAQSAMYYGFTPLGAYTSVRTLLSTLDLLNNRTQCRSITSIIDLVQCPVGFRRAVDTAESCAARGVSCPFSYQCVCGPCVEIVVQRHIAGLSIAAFSALVAGLVVVAGVVGYVLVRCVQIRHRLSKDPIWEMHKSYPIGRSSDNSHILGLTWREQPVVVKRLYRAPWCPRSMFDVDHRPTRTQMLCLAERMCRVFFLPSPLQKKVELVRKRAALVHSNIAPLLSISAGQHGAEVLAVMPRMEAGTIADLLASQANVMSDRTIQSIVTDVVNAQLFLHRQHPAIYGTNMKPHHLLLDSSFRTLLYISIRQPNTTSIWAPPECLKGDSGWTAMADVYAFSMLLYTLVNGQGPFPGKQSLELLHRVRQADEDTSVDARPPLTRPSRFNSLIEDCWAQDPADRPTFATIKMRLDSITRGNDKVRTSFDNEVPEVNLVYKNMFPEHVRRQLEAGEDVPAQHFECVTIFFSDIRNFTGIATVLEPARLKDMLNRLFIFMDNAAQRHSVHKIETVGDAFVAATNVMEPQPDHAIRMANFALEVQEGVKDIAIDTSWAQSPAIELRVGLHCGPVVAGVVGGSNLRYGLFGITMNIASRMESTGEPGKIQITAEAAQLIRKDGTLAKRVISRPGIVFVKGQGNMETFWLQTLETMRQRSSTQSERATRRLQHASDLS